MPLSVSADHREALRDMFEQESRERGFKSLSSARQDFVNRMYTFGIRVARPHIRFFSALKTKEVSMFISQVIYPYASEAAVERMYKDLYDSMKPKKQQNNARHY